MDRERIEEVKEYFENTNVYLNDNKSIGIATRKIIVEEYLANKKNLGTTLDFPCGNGEITIPLIERVDRLMMLDISRNMIALAKENLPNEFHRKTQFNNCNFFDFEFEEKFDTIVSLGILAHVPDPELLIRELSYLLKPKGVIIIQNTDAQHFWIKLLKAKKLQKHMVQKDSYQLNSISHSKLVSWINRNGLEIENIFRYETSLPLIISRHLDFDQRLNKIFKFFGRPLNPRRQFLGSKCIYKCIKT